MRPIDLCDAGLLRPFVACLDRRGIDAERHLVRRLIAPELVATGDGTITRRQCWDFFGDVIRHEGIETIGFLDNDPYSVTDLGSVGVAIREAVTLRDALLTFARLISCLSLENTVWLEETPDTTWFCCRGEGIGPEAYPTDHFTLMALVEIVRMAAGPDWRPTAIRLQTGNTRALEQAVLVAGIETHCFSWGSGVEFASELLASPLQVPAHSETTNGPASPKPLPDATIGGSLTLLLQSMQPCGGLPTSEVAAEMLGVHRTTLFRALARENLTWQLITDRVRFRSAQEMLRDPQTRIKDVAYASGYSSQRNFARAFRRMTGMSPIEFRSRLTEKPYGESTDF